MKKPSGEYILTHRITVVSTAGVANVGQGGRLFEYRDEKIAARFREDVKEELEFAARASLASQERFLKTNRRRILESYLEIRKEFKLDREIMEPHENLLGVPDSEILYEMGDYMVAFCIDDREFLTRVYDREKQVFIDLYTGGKPNPAVQIVDARGKKQALPIRLFEGDNKRELFWMARGSKKKYPVRSLAGIKIEPNPGAGLWRPHNDRLALVDRDGEGVRMIFQALGEWGTKFKQAIT